MASGPNPYGPAALIKSLIKCTDDEAETVRKVLAGVMEHRQTRAFVAIALHLSTSTRTTKGSRDDFLINEGKRQFGLFLASCAKAGLDLDLYSTPPEEQSASFRANYRNPAGED